MYQYRQYPEQHYYPTATIPQNQDERLFFPFFFPFFLGAAAFGPWGWGWGRPWGFYRPWGWGRPWWGRPWWGRPW